MFKSLLLNAGNFLLRLQAAPEPQSESSGTCVRQCTRAVAISLNLSGFCRLCEDASHVLGLGLRASRVGGHHHLSHLNFNGFRV